MNKWLVKVLGAAGYSSERNLKLLADFCHALRSILILGKVEKTQIYDPFDALKTMPVSRCSLERIQFATKVSDILPEYNQI